MKTYLPSFFLLLCVCMMSAPSANAQSGEEDWTIDLEAKTIAGLPLNATESQVIRHFGKKKTESTIRTFLNGKRLLATVVYPGTRNELTYFWKDEDRTQCFEISVSEESERWKTASGLRIGSTLSQVNRANGNAFEYAGFDWSYGGTVSNWQGGELPNWFKPVFASADEKYTIAHRGRRFFQSDEATQAESQMYVRSFRIIVGWENRQPISSLGKE
ncbi:MAG: hypothetical protein AAFQ68_17040 [Bacteroidota bacterium]